MKIYQSNLNRNQNQTENLEEATFTQFKLLNALKETNASQDLIQTLETEEVVRLITIDNDNLVAI